MSASSHAAGVGLSEPRFGPSMQRAQLRLSAAAWQAIMQQCGMVTLLRLARCCKETLAAASSPLAWRRPSDSPLRLLTDTLALTLQAAIDRSLLRFATVEAELLRDARATSTVPATLAATASRACRMSGPGISLTMQEMKLSVGLRPAVQPAAATVPHHCPHTQQTVDTLISLRDERYCWNCSEPKHWHPFLSPEEQARMLVFLKRVCQSPFWDVLTELGTVHTVSSPQLPLTFELQWREELESLHDFGHPPKSTGRFGVVEFYRLPQQRSQMIAVKYPRPDDAEDAMTLDAWLREAAFMHMLHLAAGYRPRFCLADMEGFVLKERLIHADCFVALESGEPVTDDQLRSWIPPYAIGIRMTYVHPAIELGTLVEASYLRQHPITDADCMSVLRELVGVMSYLELFGIRHRDLHLGNLLVVDHKHICVLDYGRARAYGIACFGHKRNPAEWTTEGSKDAEAISNIASQLFDWTAPRYEHGVSVIGQYVADLVRHARAGRLRQQYVAKRGGEPKRLTKTAGQWCSLLKAAFEFGYVTTELNAGAKLMVPFWGPAPYGATPDGNFKLPAFAPPVLAVAAEPQRSDLAERYIFNLPSPPPPPRHVWRSQQSGSQD